MYLSQLFLGIFLIILGAQWLGWIVLSLAFLGVFALVTGIIVLVDGYNPITVWKRP